MKIFDAVIIGAGPVGERAKDALSGKETALIALPGSPETFMRRQITALSGKTDSIPSVTAAMSGPCEFMDPQTVKVGDQTLRAKKFLIASGCGPRLPKTQGLNQTPYSLAADLQEAPAGPALIVGGSHAAVALAERLLKNKGQPVLVTTSARLLPAEDPAVAAYFTAQLLAAGAVIHVESDIVQTRVVADGKIEAILRREGTLNNVETRRLWIAAGLTPNTASLKLDRVGVYLGPEGEIVVSEEMRTSVSHIWAAGAVTGRPHLLALELEQAETAAHNMFAPFFDKRKFDEAPLPAALPTLPTLARIGLTEEEAQAKHKDTHAVKVDWPDGFLKIVGRKRSGELLGAHIVGAGAAELILYFDLAMRAGHSLFDLLEERHFPALTKGETLYQALRLFK